MKNVTRSFSKETIEKMKYFYGDKIDDTPQGAIFRARTDGAVITAYKSGKVLFQGKGAEEEFTIWSEFAAADKAEQTTLFRESSSHVKTDEQTYTNDEVEQILHESHIGSDESGTGDYFGPVTACAVFVERDCIAVLQEMGVQDSKKITDRNILLLTEEILQMDIPYSSMVIDNEKYNELQAQGWSQGKMKAILHHSVIQSVLQKVDESDVQGIVIDQFCPPAVYERHLASERHRLHNRTHFMTKAEDHSIAVATASILARAKFIQEMDRLSEWIGTELQKGASNKVDEIAAKIMREHGKDVLNKIAKVHFANTKKAKALL